LKEQLTRDRDLKITQAADYIAVTRGTRTFPWRILGIAEKDGDLITNQMVYLLAKPSQLQDTSWIKPGKVAWDWYNANNIYGVNFKSGINTQTYKYYIDFASKYGIQYVILDEGWYKLGNLLDVSADMNIEELVAYGKQKHVGIILWVVWKTLDDQFEPALNQFEKWGIKGIKVDFMQRDDQPVMNFYHKVCREAAQRKMLVDFPRRHQTGDDDAHLAQPGQYRRRQRTRAEQVEQVCQPQTQCHDPFHQNVPRSDGLHAGRDAKQRQRKEFRACL
jgi:alpha-glucosidase